jgi:hypothetical protein
MKYNPSGGGYWAKKGDRIVSSKKGLWWGSKEEAMQLSSIENKIVRVYESIMRV